MANSPEFTPWETNSKTSQNLEVGNLLLQGNWQGRNEPAVTSKIGSDGLNEYQGSSAAMNADRIPGLEAHIEQRTKSLSLPLLSIQDKLGEGAQAKFKPVGAVVDQAIEAAKPLNPVDSAKAPEQGETAEIAETTRRVEESKAQHRSEQDHVLKLAIKKMDAGPYLQFSSDLSKLEGRYSQLQEIYAAQGLPQEQASVEANKELGSTYREISRLLESTDKSEDSASPVTSKEKIALAGQIMANAARPSAIYQGLHNTCTVTALETRIYTRHPSLAAQLVTDIATAGEYTTKDGSKVKLDHGSMRPDPEATRERTDNVRSFASQLFQVTAVNIYWQKHNPNIHYEQRQPDLCSDPKDKGERLVDYASNPHKPVTYSLYDQYWKNGDNKDFHSPFLGAENLPEINQAITGEKGNSWIFDASKDYTGPAPVTSEQDLKARLIAAKRSGTLPAVLSVQTGNEPFYSDSHEGEAGGSGGWHSLTVTDLKPGEPLRVALDNQWYDAADHQDNKALVLSDLYRSMNEPTDSLTERRQRAADLRKIGTPDHFEEMDLLRMDKPTDRVNKESWDTHVVSKLDEFYKYEINKRVETMSIEELATLDRATDKARQLFWQVSPSRQPEVLELRRKTLTDAKYDEVLAQLIFRTEKVGMQYAADTEDATQEEKYGVSQAIHKLVTAVDTLPADRQKEIREDLYRQHQEDSLAQEKTAQCPL